MPLDGKPTKLKGRIPYNSKSRSLGGYFTEILAPGVFTESLKNGGYEGDVIARYEHDSRALLGRRSTGTLRLDEREDELRYEVDLPETTVGADVGALAQRGDLKHTSFCFLVEDYDKGENWAVLPDGTLLRTILKAELIEVSPVAEPAYPGSGLTAA